MKATDTSRLIELGEAPIYVIVLFLSSLRTPTVLTRQLYKLPKSTFVSVGIMRCSTVGNEITMPWCQAEDELSSKLCRFVHCHGNEHVAELKEKENG